MTNIDMLERVSRQYPVTPVTSGTSVQQGNRTEQSGGFGDLLRQELQKAGQQSAGIAFSKHAMSRVAERGIQVTPDLMNQLADTVQKAQAKGATNIVAMDASRAFIINVPSAKVITAISQEEMKENIFTNIDGAVFL